MTPPDLPAWPPKPAGVQLSDANLWTAGQTFNTGITLPNNGVANGINFAGGNKVYVDVSSGGLTVNAALFALGQGIFGYGTAYQLLLGNYGPLGESGIRLAGDVDLFRNAPDNLRTLDMLDIVNNGGLRVFSSGGAAAAIFVANMSGAGLFSIDANGLPRWENAANGQATVGLTGAAAALPAMPAKYLKVRDSAGATLVIPAYNA